jgi:carbon-monoxide dehydrogenase iron sulfur subunit
MPGFSPFFGQMVTHCRETGNTFIRQGAGSSRTQSLPLGHGRRVFSRLSPVPLGIQPLISARGSRVWCCSSYIRYDNFQGSCFLEYQTEINALTNRIRVTAEKCSGCRVCQLMCSMAHHGGAFNPRLAKLRVEINRNPDVETPVSFIDTPHVCRQCEPAPCAEACPVDAFQWDEGNGIWIIREEMCTGCEMCVEACPFDMIVFHHEIATKCDFCGGDPMCVSYCPTGALEIE